MYRKPGQLYYSLELRSKQKYWLPTKVLNGLGEGQVESVGSSTNIKNPRSFSTTKVNQDWVQDDCT